jgi:hypothetical protein
MPSINQSIDIQMNQPGSPSARGGPVAEGARHGAVGDQFQVNSSPKDWTCTISFCNKLHPVFTMRFGLCCSPCLPTWPSICPQICGDDKCEPEALTSADAGQYQEEGNVHNSQLGCLSGNSLWSWLCCVAGQRQQAINCIHHWCAQVAVLLIRTSIRGWHNSCCDGKIKPTRVNSR